MLIKERHCEGKIIRPKKKVRKRKYTGKDIIENMHKKRENKKKTHKYPNGVITLYAKTHAQKKNENRDENTDRGKVIQLLKKKYLYTCVVM